MRGAFAVAALLAVPPALAAQADVRTFVVRHGADTIAIEQVTRSAGKVEGELLFRSANQRWHYILNIGADQRVVSMDNEFRFAADASTAPARQTAHLTWTGDSVFVNLLTPAPGTQRLGSRSGSIPYINPSFGLVEQAIRRVVAMGGDTVTVPLFALAGGVTFDAKVFRGADTTVFMISGIPSRLLTDRAGTIRGGGVPSQQLVLEVIPGATTAMAVSASKPDYTAPPGAPYTAEAVRVRTPMGHTLAGTLTLPKDATGPVPAIVTITGSGLEDRDEAIPPVRGYLPFREIADALGRAGIAVLRMDDRGYGESGGDGRTATSADFADDIRAGLAYLRSRKEVDGKKLGLVGHSEGGLIGPMVAATDPALKGVVLMAGPAYSGGKILEFQNRYAIDRLPDLTDQARDSLMRGALKSIDSLRTSNPWMKFFLEYDPIATAKKVRTPVLILQGATDQQVTQDQAPILERTFREAGNRDVTLKVFPETNHLFLADPDGNPAGYPALKVVTMRPEVVQALVEWLTARLR